MPYVKVKNRGQVTIPAEFRHQLHLEEGDLLEATVEGGNIVFRPEAVIDQESVESAIDEGFKDYREGHVHGPFENIEEVDEYLKETDR